MKKDYRNISKGIVSVLIVVIIVSGFLSLLANLKKLSIFDGFRDSLEEYFPGGSSPGEEGDDGEGSSDGSGDGSADDTGDSEDSEESRCDHRDKNDNDICDKCGEGFWDGDEPDNTGGNNPGTEEPTEPENPPSEPEEPVEPTEPECQHRDANDDNLCDECGEEFSDGYEFDDYMQMPGSSMDNRKYSVFEESVPYKENGEIIKEYDVFKTEVDLNVLYWIDAFYSNDFVLELDNSPYIIPVTVEAGGYIHKVRITFNTRAVYDAYAKGINSEHASFYEYNEDELYVDILYYIPGGSFDNTVFDNFNSDTIRYNSNGKIPKSAIASIDVYVRY